MIFEKKETGCRVQLPFFALLFVFLEDDDDRFLEASGRSDRGGHRRREYLCVCLTLNICDFILNVIRKASRVEYFDKRTHDKFLLEFINTLHGT